MNDFFSPSETTLDILTELKNNFGKRVCQNLIYARLILLDGGISLEIATDAGPQLSYDIPINERKYQHVFIHRIALDESFWLHNLGTTQHLKHIVEMFLRVLASDFKSDWANLLFSDMEEESNSFNPFVELSNNEPNFPIYFNGEDYSTSINEIPTLQPHFDLSFDGYLYIEFSENWSVMKRDPLICKGDLPKEMSSIHIYQKGSKRIWNMDICGDDIKRLNLINFPTELSKKRLSHASLIIEFMSGSTFEVRSEYVIFDYPKINVDIDCTHEVLWTL